MVEVTENVVERNRKNSAEDLIKAGICPDCGAKLAYASGCKHCPVCGWEACG